MMEQEPEVVTGNVTIDVKAVAVEKWLRSLVDLAPGTKAKIRNHLSALFSNSIRHELFFPRAGIKPIANARQGAKRLPKSTVQAAFEKQIVTLPLNIIVPQRTITPAQRACDFYRHITASLKHIGLIELLVVSPRVPGEYLLLEAHVRLEILKSLGVTEAKCLLSTDDEAYTYNRHVNQIPPIAQHFMLLGALKNGLTEERIATALDVSIESIRAKRDLLNGICPEAVQVLLDKPVSAHVFGILKKMKPIRQIEAAEHMVAGGTYTVPFAKALLAVTKSEMLEEPPSAKLQFHRY
ncbi:MAG: chromosome partitioning protein ParB [Acidobacteriota bacterium]|nr:chromosome partitioning protein ParB [Acidobacteriota bacterium]